jgi:hypothetical protein
MKKEILFLEPHIYACKIVKQGYIFMCFSNVLYTFHWIWVILTSKFKTDLAQGNFTTKIFWKCSINSRVFFSFLYHFNKKVQNNTFKLHNRRNIHKSIRTRSSHEDLLIERKNMAKKHKMTNTKWHSLACWKKMMNIEIKIPTLAWVLTFQKAPQLLQNHELYFNPLHKWSLNTSESLSCALGLV